MQQISFVTNSSVNTLDHLKLLLRSLKENLDSSEHEVIVFIDSDNENTLEYLKSIQKEYGDLKIVTHDIKPCIGYSRNNNILVDLAKHDVVSYLQSDMVVSPHYDTDVLSALEDNTVLSSTRVEPPLHGTSMNVITRDFGTDPTNFDMKLWNDYSQKIKTDRELDYFFAPITFYKKVWQNLGGYDTLFRRSREDSDLMQRFVHSGVKLKQTFKAVAYHFSCVSSRGKNWFDKANKDAQSRVEKQNLADQIEMKRFVRKWGGFSHSIDTLLNKYDIDLVVKNEDEYLKKLFSMEPLFSRVWCKEGNREKMLAFSKIEHMYANQLLNFAQGDWENSSKYYNQTNYESILCVGEPKDYNIKIELDFSKENGYFLNNLFLIHKIVENMSNEPASYEMEDVKIHVKKVVCLTENFRVENPEFDMNLLHIYK